MAESDSVSRLCSPINSVAMSMLDDVIIVLSNMESNAAPKNERYKKCIILWSVKIIACTKCLLNSTKDYKTINILSEMFHNLWANKSLKIQKKV